jgi:hypothetical protein
MTEVSPGSQMTDRRPLPDDLVLVARGLEERFRLLQVPSRKTSSAEWEVVPVELRRLIPDWIPDLLEAYALVGGVLEKGDRQQPYARVFGFFGPRDFVTQLEEGSTYWGLVEHGYLPFGYEADGCVWVTRTQNGPSGEVYLLEHSDWDGGEPRKGNGLVLAASRLAFLLASMAVSPMSYNSDPRGPRCLLWYPER